MPPTFSSNLKSGSSKNLKIGVLLGGRSSERKISLRSGRAVHQALKRLGFSVQKVDPAHPDRMKKALKRIDLAFIALHGQGGEDGVIQGQLDKARIPYVGSNAKGSRSAFDKAIAKKIFLRVGIPTPAFVLVNRKNWRKKLAFFPAPFFVKPLRDGSSVGVFPVEDLAKSAETIRQALAKYGQLLVEEKIIGREFTVGILGRNPLPVIELVPKREFYDYRAKYTKGMTQYLVPAPISKRLAARLQSVALKVHHRLGLRDMSRVDMMVDDADRPFVLEANSIPGFTELSLLPKAARAKGLSFEALCGRLISFANQRRSIIRSDSSNGKKKT